MPKLREELAIPCFSDSWSIEQRFNVAALCSHVVNTISWSKNEKEKIFRQTFMSAIFEHLSIQNPREKDSILRMLKGNNDQEVIKTLCDSFKVPQNVENNEKKDICSEIMSDLLLVCIGLSPKILEKPYVENSSSPGRMNLKDRLEKVVSNVVEISSNSSTSTESSQPPQIKPAEYDSRARAILFRVASYLSFSQEKVLMFENAMAHQLYLFQQEHEAQEGSNEVHGKLQDIANETLDKHDKRKQRWRWLATSIGVVVGATAIGITGGLAAPFVAIALGTITGGFFFTASSLVLITSLFGVAGGGLTGYKMRKRTNSLKEFSFTHIHPIQDLTPVPSLYLNIVISGYLLESSNEVTTPWLPSFQNTNIYHDTFALSFDPEILLSLGKAFRRFLAEKAVQMAADEVIKRTVFGLLTSALFLPATLMKAGDLIDNPWALSADRAVKAGLVLADVLIERVQGKRPTVLIGYSMGALVIWECMQELARREEYGLLDTVILIGAPISAGSTDQWKFASTVVSRRIINAYATNDLILAIVYRMHSLDLNVAGLKAVNFPRVENVDVTKFTSGHLGYKKPETLLKILDEISAEEVK
ncbi:hypothetical protein G9A89_013343 [Geosiphon pyriformis]|nr:hypothetical protein G9A89_013343 [Geosiphon pyriformis]